MSMPRQIRLGIKNAKKMTRWVIFLLVPEMRQPYDIAGRRLGKSEMQAFLCFRSAPTATELRSRLISANVKTLKKAAGLF